MVYKLWLMEWKRFFSDGIAICIKTFVEQMMCEGQFLAECLNIFTNLIKVVEGALGNFKTERFQYFSKQGSYIKPK